MSKNFEERTNGTVLIIDDNAIFRHVVGQELSKRGYAVLEAKDGSIGFNIVQRERPDAILLDIIMKGHDGPETHRRLKHARTPDGTPLLEHVPVVYVSDLRDEQTQIRAFEQGAADFAPKSDGIELIIVKLERALSETRAKRAEEALKESELRHRQLLESITDGVLVLNKEFVYVQVNHQLAQMAQMPREMLVGHKMTDLFPGVEETVIFKTLKSVLETGKPCVASDEFTFQDGRKQWFEVHAYPAPEGILAIVTDITKRHKIKQELIEKQKLNELLLDSFPHPAMLINKQRVVLAANKIASDLGAKVGDYCWKVYGRSESLSEEDKRCAKENPYAEGIKCTFCLKDEAFKNMKAKTAQAVHASGRIWDTNWIPINEDVYLYFAMDITERKETELALKKSEERFRNFFNEQPTYCFMISSDGKIIDINKSALKALGYDREDLIGKTPFDTIYTEAAIKRSQKLFKDWKKTGRIRNEKLTIRTKAGEEKTVLLNADAIYDEEGKLRHSFSTQTDISDRVEAEREVTKLLQAIDQLPVSVVITNTEGVIEYVNPAMCETTGFAKPEVIGKHTRIFKSGEQNSEFYEELWRTITSGKNWRGEFHNIKKNGVLYWESAVISPVTDSTGRISHFIAVKEDVTKSKELEESLLEERVRNERSNAISVLAGGIAHDLNNYLAVFLMTISMAKDMIPKSSPVHEALQRGTTAVGMAQRVTNQLLAVAKDQQSFKKPESIESIVREAIEFSLHGSNCLSKYLIDDNLRAVNVDRGQISEVVQNLVINADQAMPNGGEICISIENVIVTDSEYLKPGSYVKVSIKDEGVGISQNVINNIFDPYFTTKQKGSGLGLAVSYSHTEKHGGHLTVDSIVEQGSVFTFYLPSTNEEVVEQKPERQKVSHSGKILLMDDSEMVRDGTGTCLNLLGYDVDYAVDGKEAVNMYKEAKYDLVILDLTVPGGMGGLEANRLILEHDPAAITIVTSGYSTDADIEKYMIHGFRGALPKPFTPGIMEDVIIDVLSLKGDKG